MDERPVGFGFESQTLFNKAHDAQRGSNWSSFSDYERGMKLYNAGYKQAINDIFLNKLLMTVHADNLIMALDIAIQEQTKTEAQRGYTGKSALLAGWEKLRESLAKGESINLFP